MFAMNRRKLEIPAPEAALPGRAAAIATAETHFVTGRPLSLEPPEGMEAVVLGMGCFWGAERVFWEQPGVWVTMVGYAGGHTPNPTYDEVCSGGTGHAEVVGVVFDPAQMPFGEVLRLFWENHDPTQGMRQGNDVGTQYRSAIYCMTAGQRAAADASRAAYGARLRAHGWGDVTTEIADAGRFYFAEDYHQQYLARNPAGYCGIGGTGVSCPVGTGV